MRQYYLSKGVSFDFCLFTTYDRQIEALMAGFIDIAWSGPLAHVRVQKRTGGKSLSLGMRDVDQGFATSLVVRSDAGIKSVADLAGKRLATASHDSPQGCVLPLQALKTAEGGGAELLKTLHVTRFDRDLGKHGDTAAGELEVRWWWHDPQRRRSLATHPSPCTAH
jgi:ABC-type phosphate/phosphonate transport system substrate-binding protein